MEPGTQKAFSQCQVSIHFVLRDHKCMDGGRGSAVSQALAPDAGQEWPGLSEGTSHSLFHRRGTQRMWLSVHAHTGEDEVWAVSLVPFPSLLLPLVFPF